MSNSHGDGIDAALHLRCPRQPHQARWRL